MWNNYFLSIQLKYSMRIGQKKPLVIRMDGQATTRNKEINLLSNEKNKFMDAMETTVIWFTRKYKCYAIYGSDEVSFIMPDPSIIMNETGAMVSQEITSVFSQYFYQEFNDNFDLQKVFFHAKCFSIPEGKINSYVKYRSECIENVMIEYFWKRYIDKSLKENVIKLRDKLEICKQSENYNILKTFQKGFLYYDGKRYNLKEFFEGKLEKYEDVELNDLFSNLI